MITTTPCLFCGATNGTARSLDGSLVLCEPCYQQQRALERATLRAPRPFRPPSAIVKGRLFVGCEHSTWDALRLRRECNIRHVIVAARADDTHLQDGDEGIRLTILDVDDDPVQDLSQHFDAVYAIYQATNPAGAVLIHCVSGISRSGCLAVALLMRDQSLTYPQALEEARRGRPEISPNSGFQAQLREYEKKLLLHS